MPKDKERGTEAVFKSLQRLLGEERGCRAALCAIGCRTDPHDVLFWGLKIRARHTHHLHRQNRNDPNALASGFEGSSSVPSELNYMSLNCERCAIKYAPFRRLKPQL